MIKAFGNKIQMLFIVTTKGCRVISNLTLVDTTADGVARCYDAKMMQTYIKIVLGYTTTYLAVGEEKGAGN